MIQNQALPGNRPPSRITIMPDEYETYTDLECTHCGGKYFQSATRFKRIPAVRLGAGADQIMSIEDMVCANPQCRRPLERDQAMKIAAEKSGHDSKASENATVIGSEGEV